MAQDAVAGGGPAGSAPPGVPDPERSDLVRVRLPPGLHSVSQPHATHHRLGQETEQDNRPDKSGSSLA